jgi:hypothetical protein
MDDFLQRIEGQEPERGLERAGRVVPLPLPHQKSGEARQRLFVERLALGLEPLLERRRVVDLESCEEVARVDRRRLGERGGSALGHEPVERLDVRIDGAGLESHHRLVDAQRTRGEHLPQARERLAQAVPGPRRRDVGPEERGQLVARLGVSPAADEIGQQCRGFAPGKGDGDPGLGVRGKPPEECQLEPPHRPGTVAEKSLWRPASQAL